MKVLLYGGGGYVGTHLVDELLRRGAEASDILILDRVAPRKNLGATYVRSAGALPEFSDNDRVVMVHLACPRVSKFNRAEAKLTFDQGVKIACANNITQEIFLSSLSVNEFQTSDYVEHKNEAENCMAERGAMIFQLPTLFGARRGLVYRWDQGISRIAFARACGIPAQIDESVCRCFAPVYDATMIIAAAIQAPAIIPGVRVPFSRGCYLHEIVEAGADELVRWCGESTRFGYWLPDGSLAHLRQCFKQFVEDIDNGRVSPI